MANGKNSIVNPTKGVKTLLGDPKKALWKLAWPIIAANMFQAVYSLVDTFWVSGLGVDALASVGFFFPFFFIAISIGMGIGIGGGSAVSRKIGAHDRDGAGMVGTHTLIITLIASAVYTIPLLIFCAPIFAKMGAARILAQTVEYGRIMFAGTVLFFFSQVTSALLRSEGDTKRAMQAMVLGSILNLILDPLFIYGFKLGVAGAALASVLSIAITSALMFDWLFLKRNTYIPLHFKNFKFKKEILKEIFKVGIPASVQMTAMSFSMFLMNLIVVNVGGTDGIAVFATGWRVVTLGTMPVFGIAAAVTAISGAAYGAKNYQKLHDGYFYALRGGINIEIPAVILLLIFAPHIAHVFTHAEDSARITQELTTFLRIVSISFIAVALGPISSALFQGIGHGFKSLITTVVRTLVLTPIFALTFAYVFKLQLNGIWLGIATANLTGAVIGFFWASSNIRKLQAKGAKIS